MEILISLSTVKASLSSGICKRFRLDQGTCVSGCAQQGVKPGNACPFDVDDDDGNQQSNCPGYK